MFRLALAAVATAVLVFGENFAFTVGSPVASQDYHFKMAAFVFRTEGCADSSKAQITATAEGVVGGERRSLPLKLLQGLKPGVLGVERSWPQEGQWVVTLKGTCDGQNAGAIIPIGPKGFIRESSKFYSRPPSNTEIEASLKALQQSTSK